MTKSRFRNTLLGIGATAAALAVGYFGVQYLAGLCQNGKIVR